MESKNKEVLQVEYSSSIALCSYIVWASIYGYFALGFDSDPDVCVASDNKDVKVASSASDGTDVGTRFRHCFEWLFYLSVLMMTISLTIACCKSAGLRKAFGVIGMLAQWALTIIVLVLLISRFRHSGRVCSGDFLGDNDST